MSAVAPAVAQHRLLASPQWSDVQARSGRVSEAYRQSIEAVRRTPFRWIDGGKAVAWRVGDRWQKYTLSSKKLEDLGTQEPPIEAPPAGPRGGRPVARGRQRDQASSPDGKQVAFYRDRQLWVRNADGEHAKRLLPLDPATTAPRVKYGIASWVYGEELDQRDAFGWCPTGKRLWCYRFDETEVLDYFLTVDVLKTQNRVDTEPYPKAGAVNPVVGLVVVDPASGEAISVPTTPPGTPLHGIGHYVYDMSWSHDGQEIRFFRMDRLQRTREFCGYHLGTRQLRVIQRQTSPTWVDNRPVRRALGKDEEIWRNEVGGFFNFTRLNLITGRETVLTRFRADAGAVVKVDEPSQTAWVTARNPENAYCVQLYRLNLRNGQAKLLTDPTLNHSVILSPDGNAMVDIAENAATPPVITLRDRDGKPIRELLRADPAPFLATGARPNERFTFLAADGKTPLVGTLEFPSTFDPNRKYPLLVQVYAGPESGGSPERYDAPSRWTELGFLVASFEGRGTLGRGWQFLTSVYAQLGIVEIDDQAAGVRALLQRPYVRADRVGIHGSSYGGYASAMAILRFPELFHAALAESSVTDWRNYDTIYTERYLGLPQDNAEAYRASSTLTYAGQLRGHLRLVYGTLDDNVHPSNTYQLAKALQRAGRSFSMMALPDEGHSGVSDAAAMEFLVETLIGLP